MDSTVLVETIRISGAINPFNPVTYSCSVPAGVTLHEALSTFTAHIAQKEQRPEAQAERLLTYCNVFLNNISVPPEKWHDICIKHGDSLICNVMPLGGGGDKNPLATILTIAVIATASVVSGGLGGGLLGGIAAAGVMAVGTLAVNALFPVTVPDTNTDDPQSKSTFQITSYQNQIKQYQSLQVALGRVKAAPAIGALPYTENSGDDQYWTCLYVWGYCNDADSLDTRSLKIGDTLLSSYSAETLDARHYILEPGKATQLYKNTVIEQNVGILLDNLPPDGWAQATTLKTNKISVDIAFPSGLYMIDNAGKMQQYQVVVDIQYALAGTADWKDVTSNAYIPEFVGRIGGSFTVDIGAKATVYIDRFDYTIRYSEYSNAALIGVHHTVLYTLQTTSVNVVEVVTDYRTALMKANNYFQATINVQLKDSLKISEGRINISDIAIRDQIRSAKIYTFQCSVPESIYDIRVRRFTAKSDDLAVSDSCYFQSTRSILPGSAIKFSYPLLITDLRIKAGTEINGSVNNLTGILTNIIPDWNSATQTWEPAATSNPASIIRYVLTGEPNEKRISADKIADMIDNDSFVAFWHHCELNGFEYNKYIESAVDIQQDLIPEIAAAGRAFVLQPNGKYTIIIDEAKDYPVQHFTPVNSHSFETSRVFIELPHAFRIAFTNADNDFQNDEYVVYDEGYSVANATLFERMEITGVTNHAQIYKLARERMRAARLRPEMHTLNVDIEYLVAKLRDRVRVSHDVLMVGLAYGRLKAVFVDETGNTTAVTVEDIATIEDNISYGITIRSSRTGLTVEREVTADEADPYRLNLVYPAIIDVSPGDVYSFGEFGKTTEDYIISQIETSENFTAKLTLIAYAPTIYTDPSEATPPFTPNVSSEATPQSVHPAPPIMLSHREELELRGNEAVTIATFTWLAPTSSPVAVTNYQAEYRRQGGTWIPLGFAPSRMIEFNGLAQGYYDFRVRSVSQYGQTSEWLIGENSYIYGDTLPPDDVTGLTTILNNNRLQLVWNNVNDLRTIYYEVRKGETWDSGQIVQRNLFNAYQLISDGRYFVKAYTKSGYYSLHPAELNVEATGGIRANVVVEYIENPAWLGELINFYRADEFYRVDDVYSLIDVYMQVQSGAIRLDGISQFGYYTIPDEHATALAYAAECNISLRYSAAGYKQNDIYAIEDIYTMDDIYSVVNAGYIVIPEISIMDNAGDWQYWQKFQGGKYIGKTFKLRLYAEIIDPEIFILVSDFEFSIDVPDRRDSFENVHIPDSGLLISFDPPFNAPPIVVATIVSDSGSSNIISVDSTIPVTAQQAMIYIKTPEGQLVEGNANVFAEGY